MTIREATEEQLKKLMHRQKISSYSLSVKTGVPISTIKSVLNGKSQNPGIATMHKLLKGLDTNIREFYTSSAFAEVESSISKK